MVLFNKILKWLNRLVSSFFYIHLKFGVLCVCAHWERHTNVEFKRQHFVSVWIRTHNRCTYKTLSRNECIWKPAGCHLNPIQVYHLCGLFMLWSFVDCAWNTMKSIIEFCNLVIRVDCRCQFKWNEKNFILVHTHTIDKKMKIKTTTATKNRSVLNIAITADGVHCIFIHHCCSTNNINTIDNNSDKCCRERETNWKKQKISIDLLKIVCCLYKQINKKTCGLFFLQEINFPILKDYSFYLRSGFASPTNISFVTPALRNGEYRIIAKNSSSFLFTWQHNPGHNYMCRNLC